MRKMNNLNLRITMKLIRRVRGKKIKI